jgi:hypothetical protein
LDEQRAMVAGMIKVELLEAQASFDSLIDRVE